MASREVLIAQALQWQSEYATKPERDREYAEALAILPRTTYGQIVLHDLAMRLVTRAEGPHDEGARRWALMVFEHIAEAQETLRAG